MSLFELFLLAIGLSMDAFAVAVCKGLGMRQLKIHHALLIGLFFGSFQAGMPLIGWALGTRLVELVAPIDHWIVLGLLGYIGAKMIWEALHEDENCTEPEAFTLDLKELLMLAIATSIDALAAGISLALLNVDLIFSVSAIGVTTFVLSVVGVYVGKHFGSRWEKAASIVGGITLICIGIRVVLQHLGFLAM